ncbi:MAG: hypothetical protein V7K97_30530 [Nostoc sp.]
MTITLQSPYPNGDLATRSVGHRRSFEWQKPLLGFVTVIMLWITGSRGNRSVSVCLRRQFLLEAEGSIPPTFFVKKLSFAAHWLPIFENR